MGFEGAVRHPAPLRLGLAEGALAGCALAVPLVLAAGLWLRGPCKPQFSALFRSLFAPRATALGSSGGAPWLAAPWPCLSCSCACCRALAARPWQVFLVGFEGTVRHLPSLNFRLFFGPFFHVCHCALAEGALAGCALAVP